MGSLPQLPVGVGSPVEDLTGGRAAAEVGSTVRTTSPIDDMRAVAILALLVAVAAVQAGGSSSGRQDLSSCSGECRPKCIGREEQDKVVSNKACKGGNVCCVNQPLGGKRKEKKNVEKSTNGKRKPYNKNKSLQKKKDVKRKKKIDKKNKKATKPLQNKQKNGQKNKSKRKNTLKKTKGRKDENK